MFRFACQQTPRVRPGNVALWLMLCLATAPGALHAAKPDAASRNQAVCDRLAKRYKIDFLTTDGKVNAATWKQLDYQFGNENDQDQLARFLKIFEKEFSRYPVDFVKKSGLKQVVFVKAMSFKSQPRAAVPDYVAETLYYDFTMRSQDQYQYQVIHHEYYHMIEEQLNGNVYFKDPKWTAFNEAGFKYGNGGAANRDRSLTVLNFPRPGFVNGYAMTGLEEDKAEIWAMLFVGPKWKRVRARMAKDEILKNKVTYMQKSAGRFSKSMNDKFWKQLHRN